jgi:outer membrane receptor for ferrienterochelin and colicins
LKKIFLFLGIVLPFIHLSAQNIFSCIIKDAQSQEHLQNVSVVLKGTSTGIASDSSGMAIIKKIPNGKHVFAFTSVGYKEYSLEVNFPLPVVDSVFTILLEPLPTEEEQVVVVASSRTESRIEDLPTKIEVLGVEEVNEEVGIKPGNIASLLGDVAGIQIQQTSATTGNAEMRVQGLPGEYTQILKDGMPLFGGYSGSFSILQIPPLDLKQIEIVKGASSTLYGGGAIAGMVNLISKRPKEGEFEKTILINHSTLKENNINLYLSNRKNKTGFTFFSGANLQQSVDVNKDGFSDVPDTKSFFFHPTLFIYPNKKNLVYIGYNGVFENRKGGDMQVVDEKPDAQHQYFISNKSTRHTIDLNWENKVNTTDRLILKGTSSWFDRKIETNVFGMDARQLSYFSEISYLKKWDRNDLVTGINFTGEDFHKKLPDSTQITNYSQNTIGVFVQDDWKASSKFIIQTGIRFDHHNEYGNFALPRISVLYKISSHFTTRLGSGLGYKIPTVFSNDIDERDYPNILPLQNVKAERSIGANWDVNYHQKINNWDITINQAFFVNRINDPIITKENSTGDISFYNEAKPITTKGLETYVQVFYDALEIYAGYIYTSAKKLYDNNQPYLSLIAKNKFATIIAYEFSHNFRAGIESAYTGKQYLDDGSRTPGYLFVAAMMRYDYKKLSFVLNCENLLDYRQTKKESIVIPPVTNPMFKQLWAPIDGRVVNFSIRIKL